MKIPTTDVAISRITHIVPSAMKAIRAESLIRLISGLLASDTLVVVLVVDPVVVVVVVTPRPARHISFRMLIESPQLSTQMSFYKLSRT